MRKESDIRRYSADELRARRARGESRTNIALVESRSEADLERIIAEDADFRDIPADWHEASVAVMPKPKVPLSVRLDEEVVDWFKAQGPGYQTRMNAALLAFVRAKKARV